MIDSSGLPSLFMNAVFKSVFFFLCALFLLTSSAPHLPNNRQKKEMVHTDQLKYSMSLNKICFADNIFIYDFRPYILLFKKKKLICKGILMCSVNASDNATHTLQWTNGVCLPETSDHWLPQIIRKFRYKCHIIASCYIYALLEIFYSFLGYV